jgi:hypothetical protein
MQLDIATIVSRFQFYARDNQDIKFDPSAKNKSFMLCDMQDVADALKTGIQFPCLFLQTPTFDKEGGVDQSFEHVSGSFTVMIGPVKVGDYAGRMQAYSDSKAICDQVIAHMIQDSDDYFDGAMPKTAEGPFGPVGDQVFGWGVNFSFEQAIGMELNPAKWGASS